MSSFFKRYGPCLLLDSSALKDNSSDTIVSFIDKLQAWKHFSMVNAPDGSTASSPKCPRSLQLQAEKNMINVTHKIKTSNHREDRALN